MPYLPTPDPDPLVMALLAALAPGDISIGLRGLDDVAAYDADRGHVELSEYASPAEQRDGLIRALQAIAGHFEPPRPQLALVPDGAA